MGEAAVKSQFNRVLLVEDDVDIQENLRIYLELEGFVVDSAFNGREALTYLQEHKSGRAPFVILLDLMMPIMTGYELLEKIQESSVCTSIPIIILSAAPDLERTGGSRVASFIRKPFSLELLVRTIREVRARVQSESVS